MPLRHRAPVFLILALALATTLPLLLASTATAALPGDAIWAKTFSSNKQGDVYYDIARGPSDVVYAVGITKASEETSTLLLVKYTAGGKRVWVRTHKWADRAGSAGVAVAVDKAGSVLVAGSVGNSPDVSVDGRDIVVLKYGPGGKLKWTCRYDGPAHADDLPTDMVLDGAGAAYVVGTSNGVGTGEDYVELNVRDDGKLMWTFRYDGPRQTDYASAVTIDANAATYVTGSSEGVGNSMAAATFKISHNGTKIWAQRVSYGAGLTHAEDILYRSVGGEKSVFITGSTYAGIPAHMDLFVARLKPSTGTGEAVGQVDASGGDDVGHEIAVDASGSVYAAGDTTAASGVSHALLAKVTFDGTVAWAHEFWEGDPGNEASFQAVGLDGSGNVYCGGYAFSPGAGDEAYSVSLSAVNELRWAAPNLTGGSALADDTVRDLLVRPGGVYLAGQVSHTDSGTDALLKKIAP